MKQEELLIRAAKLYEKIGWPEWEENSLYFTLRRWTRDKTKPLTWYRFQWVKGGYVPEVCDGDITDHETVALVEKDLRERLANAGYGVGGTHFLSAMLETAEKVWPKEKIT